MPLLLATSHTWVSNSLCQTTLFPSPGRQQAIYTTRTTTITQNIVPLTFPNEQTFGNPLDHAKPNGHIHIAFCNIAGFPLDVHNNSKVQDLWAFQTQFQVDIFGHCESNLNWKKCHQLEGYTNGSALKTPSVLLLATTSMMTLDNNNLVAPFSWVMERSHPLSLLLVLTLQGWDAGSGLPSWARQELPHISLALTAPVTPPLPKLAVSGHSNAPTYLARRTPANPGQLSFTTLAMPSLPGKQMEITSSSWLI